MFSVFRKDSKDSSRGGSLGKAMTSSKSRPSIKSLFDTDMNVIDEGTVMLQSPGIRVSLPSWANFSWSCVLSVTA